MSQFQFGEDDDSIPALSVTGRVMTVVVRFVGVLLLVVGLIIGLKVIGEAWSLYTDPDRIERFATAIERGSNLDRALAPMRPTPLAVPAPNPLLDSGVALAPAPGLQDPPPPFRLSYFAGWFIALLLLLLIGRLSIAAIRTGGELALYDIRLRQVARSLVREATRRA